MRLEIGCLSTASFSSPDFLVAAARAGAPCFVETEAASGQRLEDWVRACRTAGVGVDAAVRSLDQLPEVLTASSAPLSRVLFTAPWTAVAADVAALRKGGVEVWLEVVSAAEGLRADALGPDRIVVKGNEAAGRVGEDTTLILLQKLRGKVSAPLVARGGVGLHTASACLVAGASGVLLDWQLSLCDESDLPAAVRRKVERMDGSETILLGQEIGRRFRVYLRPGEAAAARLAEQVGKIRPDAADLDEQIATWSQAVDESVRCGELLALGQDACFAKLLAERYRTVGAVIRAIRSEALRQVRVAAARNVLRKGGPLAESHGTAYPIVQGPMTRVSDRAEFADAVEAGGGLPVLALALMRRKQVRELLEQTSEKLGERPWGVGVLGFVPQELREEQMEEVLRCPPKFAVIAGGRPDQAKELEEKGIATYLHVPSPELLRLYARSGVRRIILEGRECGGHVGPRTSFVLWEQMVEVLLDHFSDAKVDPSEFHVLFAGGIHDDVSAAMVSAIAAPLSERGVKVGALLGTAYLFTAEAVQTGAIQPTFQQEAINCQDTVLLESGVGHATRCADTAFPRHFLSEKQRLQSEGAGPDKVREELEGLNLGRLRVASKGVVRESGPDGKAVYVTVDEEKQRTDGMFMIGQVAGLRSAVCTVEELHAQVAASSEFLAQLTARKPRVGDTPSAVRPADVAIVGMSCLLPGANDLDTYWKNILDKVLAVSEVPKQRWDWELYFDEDRRARDKIYSRWGGFIGDVPFDPVSFGMPPNSVPSVEPMQLLTLKLVRDALEDAGYRDRVFDRSRTSVIVGTGGGVGELGLGYGFRSMIPHFVDRAGGQLDQAADFIDGLAGSIPEWTEDSFAGLLLNVASGRVANRFDFGGTNFIVDAACATSLAALRLAANELETGSSDMVVAAGVDMVQSPFGFLCFSKTQALSPTGQCRTFDESADGIVIAEGLVVCVLKRLEDAERDGDRIYAVLKSVGASSDGRDKGLTAPRPAGQVRALERAYEKAGFPADTIGLVEAHGTGTVVGDRTEVSSLATYFQPSETNLQTCALGSVKSMIGHTKCTAGFAGLAKAALGLYHQTLPPTIGVTKPNSTVNFAETPFFVNTESLPWIERADGTPRRAGVSAFGFGGTNFHATLEEYRADASDAPGRPVAHWAAELLVWRAASPEPIRKSVEALVAALADGSQPRLRDLAAAVCWEQGRGEGECCLAVSATSLDDLRAKLEQFLAEQAKGSAAIQNPRGLWYSARSRSQGEVAFLFPGQGSQRVGMLRDLSLALPVVRETLERADKALEGRLPKTLSRFVYPPPAFTEQESEQRSEQLKATNVAQPALGAADAAMLELLRSLGVRAGHLAGHSYGELAALYAGGALPLDDLIRISEARGRIMVESARDGLGTMAAVSAGEAAVRKVIDGLEGVWIANLNAPVQTVISGTDEGVAGAIEALKQAGLKAKPIPVACAFHSPLMQPARDAFARELEQLSWRPLHTPVLSNATVKPYPAEPEAFAGMLADHLTQSVRFADQIRRMHADGVRTFIEVGPGSVLTGLVGRTLEGSAHTAIALDASAKNGLVQLTQSLAQLAVAGLPLRMQPLFEGRVKTGVSVKQLLADSKPKPLSPTTWMLTAGQSVPLKKFESGEWGAVAAKKAEPASLFAEKPAPAAAAPVAHAPAPAASAPVVAAQPPAAPQSAPGGALSTAMPSAPSQPSFAAPAAVSSAAPSLLEGHSRLMSKFLDTHRRIMMAALQGAPAAELAPAQALPQQQPVAQIAAPAVPAAAPAEVAVAPQAPSAPVAAPAPVPAPAPVAEPEPVPAVAAVAVAAAEPQPAGLTREVIAARLLALVADRTGYPEDMLQFDLDLEADLSIDSIKRVEIFGALQEEAGFEDSTADIESLAKLKTLGQIVDWLVVGSQAAPDEASAPAPASAPAAEAPASARAAVSVPAAASKPADEDRLVRQVLRLDDALPLQVGLELSVDGCILILDDGHGSAEKLAVLLEDLGATAEIFPRDIRNERSASELVNGLRGRRGRIGAVVNLAPLAPVGAEDLAGGFRPRFETELLTMLNVTRFLEPDLRESRGRILTASRMGGGYGIEMAADAAWWPGAGATCGFVKSLAREWPEVLCRTVDFETDAPLETVLDCLVAELIAPGDHLEIGYRRGRRLTLGVEEAHVEGHDVVETLGTDSVILVTGGGGGINAETAIALAERTPARFILTGRTPLAGAEEPAWLASARSEREIKAALIDNCRQTGRKPVPVEIEAEYRSIRKARELRSALGRLKATGSTVDYRTIDASDPDSFGELIDQIYAEYGRLDGVVHGAGIIEDKLLRDKTLESFERVLKPKIDGALTLAAHLRPETLKFLFFYSSVSGRYGNRGQSDYAAANETLNKLARWLNDRWPARVAALNWGPWKDVGGMVSPELAEEFAKAGVQMVSAASGCRAFVAEVGANGQAEPETIYGGPLNHIRRTPRKPDYTPKTLQVGTPLLLASREAVRTNGNCRIVIEKHAERDVYLTDHQLDGRPVMPMAMVLEFVVEGAEAGWPEFAVSKVRDFSILRGITFEPSERRVLRLELEEKEVRPDGVDLTFELFCDGAGAHLHYRGQVEMRRSATIAPVGPLRLHEAQPMSISLEEAYEQWLFHGPLFEAVVGIEALGRNGVTARLRTSSPRDFFAPAIEGDWAVDPAMIDAGLQLVILWARTYRDETPLPSRLGCFHRLGPPPADGEIRCEVEIQHRPDSPNMVTDLRFSDSSGRLFARMENMQTACSRALNRLSGRSTTSTANV
ncbi:MAG: SDR family NAD(P)-dependent oxidoreductase [Acidobacteria bacterium]|nr:SDR family NAD(P)-dependent oxidoreductase [Acidobacteriota bacterium]